jgi:hypothetical protein
VITQTPHGRRQLDAIERGDAQAAHHSAGLEREADELAEPCPRRQMIGTATVTIAGDGSGTP